MRDPLEMLMVVGPKLSALQRRVAFVGGATTGLMVTDPAAPPPRSTLDVDLIVEVGDMSDYAMVLGPALRRIGAKEDDSPGAPLCRWILDGVVVDVMPTDARVLGFSNVWYASALDSAVERSLPNGSSVRVVDAPHFLATKIEAFLGRGGGDFQASKDIEDIVAIVDGRTELLDEVRSADGALRIYLAGWFERWLADEGFVDAVPGHLPGNADNYARAEWILERLRALITSR